MILPAFYADTPMLLLAGSAPLRESDRGALQEMNLNPEEIHETTMSERNEAASLKLKSVPPQWNTSGFDHLEESKCSEQDDEAIDDAERKHTCRYFPLADTLRLYTGWLLTGYLTAYFLGSYQLIKPLPFEMPYVLAFLYSPLILSFTLACFLFLLATSIHRKLNGGPVSAVLAAIASVALFVFYRANT